MSGSLGLISLGPQGDVEAQERRAELVPSSPGDVLGAAVAEGFSDSPGPRMARIARRGYVETGDGNYAPLNAFDELDQPTGLLPPSPMVPLATLKEQYEIPGVLSFDKDTPQSVAQSLYEHKAAQMRRADIIRRNDSAVASGMAARFVASMIGSIADPVNLAAMFIPGVGEANVARMFGVGAGASTLARAGVRAGAGGSAGAAGMLALEPLNYALMGQERDDWTMAGALANVLFGTVAGAGLHSGLGALAERSRGLPDWAPARINSERFQATTPEAQEALARHAIAAQVEGRPVEAAALLDVADPAPRPGEAANEALIGYYRAVQDADMHAPVVQAVDGVEVAWPDRAHADLFDVGQRLLRNEEVPDEEIAWLWRHFRGLVESEAERPFSSPEHVRDLAREYAGPDMDMRGPMAATPEGGRFDAYSVVATDAKAPYAERAASVARAALGAAERLRVERSREALSRMEAAQRPDPRAAEPPPPAGRTPEPPPEPAPRGEPSAASKDVAELEKQIGALDALLKMREGDKPVLGDRIKEFDALVDEETKVESALFQAAANCIVRTR